jgi:hypothetical protein
VRLLSYSRTTESLYEAIERALREGTPVWGKRGDKDERLTTIDDAIEHARSYGIMTLSVGAVMP